MKIWVAELRARSRRAFLASKRRDVRKKSAGFQIFLIFWFFFIKKKEQKKSK